MQYNYAINRITGCIHKWSTNNPWVGYTVEDRQTYKKLGYVVLGGDELAFIPGCWGRGIGTEASAALTNVLMPRLVKCEYDVGALEINSTVHIDHIPSSALTV